MIERIVIENIRPATPTGIYPAKGVVGDPSTVSATVFKDGHEPLDVQLKWRPSGADEWESTPMRAVGGDRFESEITPDTIGMHEFRIEAKSVWFYDWEHDDDLTRSEVKKLWADRPRAKAGAWYELFPRSEGGLAGTVKRIPALAEMGFDVLYLPPIHPIGHTNRKGANNTLTPGPDDPGSPWSIGSEEGGHTAIDPGLGTFADFERLVEEAGAHDMEIALDYALQCSPDHPWAREHPEWFKRSPDGTIRYAENPPKKYQDIYPINFWPEKGQLELWEACKQILQFWINRGVKIFRVDNPHTKPLAFWEWVIPAVQLRNPDVIFLAEAFTTPAMMSKLAELGFSQSYTYFTWRTTKQELTDYALELAYGPKADYMRPNFWPNTPDILSGPLRGGAPGVFKQRLVLAATMSPSYGIYSGYELCENQPASDKDEEYLNSEKYQVRSREWDRPGSLIPFVTGLNDIRRRHPALMELTNIHFHRSDNDHIIVYSKTSRDSSDVVLVMVNLDAAGVQRATVQLDAWVLGLSESPWRGYEELTRRKVAHPGSQIKVQLDPEEPALIVHVGPRPA